MFHLQIKSIFFYLIIDTFSIESPACGSILTTNTRRWFRLPGRYKFICLCRPAIPIPDDKFTNRNVGIFYSDLVSDLRASIEPDLLLRWFKWKRMFLLVLD